MEQDHRKILTGEPDHFTALAEAIDEMRETVNAVVQGLISDGFDEDQARTIATGIFGSMTRRNDKREGQDD